MKLGHWALVALVFTGCAGSTIGYTRDTAEASGSATAVIASERSDGADELSVEISLPDPPPVMPSMDTVDLAYLFVIKNTGASPARIKRINIASAAGAYRIERRSRTYKNSIDPGATEKLEFVARAYDLDPNLGVRGPMTIRAEIEFENAEGTKKAAVVRNVGTSAAVGVTKTP